MLVGLFLLFLAVHLSGASTNVNCTGDDACSCTFDSGHTITLHNFISSKGNTYVEETTITGDIYRFYPCGATETWGVGCDTTSTACQYSGGDQAYYSLGQTTMYTITEAVLDGDNSYLKIAYTGGTNAPDVPGDRKCDIMIICAAKGTDDTLAYNGENPIIEYQLEFQSYKACPVSGGLPVPSGGGGGADGAVLFIVLLLVLFLAVVTYLVVGVLLMVFWKGAKGFEIIPNLGFWKDFPFLLKDGFLFTFACIPQAREWIGGDKSYTTLK